MAWLTGNAKLRNKLKQLAKSSASPRALATNVLISSGSISESDLKQIVRRVPSHELIAAAVDVFLAYHRAQHEFTVWLSNNPNTENEIHSIAKTAVSMYQEQRNGDYVKASIISSTEAQLKSAIKTAVDSCFKDVKHPYAKLIRYSTSASVGSHAIYTIISGINPHNTPKTRHVDISLANRFRLITNAINQQKAKDRTWSKVSMFIQAIILTPLSLLFTRKRFNNLREAHVQDSTTLNQSLQALQTTERDEQLLQIGKIALKTDPAAAAVLLNSIPPNTIQYDKAQYLKAQYVDEQGDEQQAKALYERAMHPHIRNSSTALMCERLGAACSATSSASNSACSNLTMTSVVPNKSSESRYKSPVIQPSKRDVAASIHTPSSRATVLGR